MKRHRRPCCPFFERAGGKCPRCAPVLRRPWNVLSYFQQNLAISHQPTYLDHDITPTHLLGSRYHTNPLTYLDHNITPTHLLGSRYHTNPLTWFTISHQPTYLNVSLDISLILLFLRFRSRNSSSDEKLSFVRVVSLLSARLSVVVFSGTSVKHTIFKHQSGARPSANF